MSTAKAWTERDIEVDGMNFHYLEAGDPAAETVLLVHSGEYGACAEFSWEYLIPELAPKFHVIAPDMIGYGHSSKLFDFADPLGFRIRTITRFCEALGIDDAQFVGNSMGGTLMCYVATMDEVPWPMRTMVLASGGGKPLDNEFRKLIQDYDGSFEQMDAIMVTAFTRRWYDDENIRKRVEMSRVVGQWECLAASRLKAPWRESQSALSPFQNLKYEEIRVPTVIVAGGQDKMRERGYEQELGERIPDCEVHLIEEADHLLNLEFADQFNPLAIDFLERHSK